MAPIRDHRQVRRRLLRGVQLSRGLEVSELKGSPGSPVGRFCHPCDLGDRRFGRMFESRRAVKILCRLCSVSEQFVPFVLIKA